MLSVAGLAGEVQFRPAQTISAGAASLAPGTYAIPCVTDWNGDGRKDLMWVSGGTYKPFLNSLYRVYLPTTIR